MKTILISYLLVNAWTDWKRKEIDLIYTMVFIVIGFAYKFFYDGVYYWAGLLPGVFLVILSLIWKNHVGCGDGIIVMVFGWICGLNAACNILIGGFLLAACVGILYGVAGNTKQVELPFVPFFLGSYLLDLWMQRGGI